MREALKNAHPLVQFSALVLVGFVSMFILLGAIMIPFALSGSGIGFISNPGSVSDPNEPAVLVLKLMQIMQAIGLFVIPYLVFRWIYKQDKTYSLINVSTARNDFSIRFDNSIGFTTNQLFSRMEQQFVSASSYEWNWELD